MSEYLNNKEKRIEELMQFSMGMMEGKKGKELIDKYEDAIKNATPCDILEMEDRQVKKGVKPANIKAHIEKILNVINPHLEKYHWDKPEKSHPIYYLMEENRELEKLLKQMKEPIKRIELESKKEGSSVDITEEMEKLKEYLLELKSFNRHYLRKENILFPYLEQKWDFQSPLRVMWSLHDDIRSEWKALENLLGKNHQFNEQIRKHFGVLFMLMFKMIYKEEKILYPVAVDSLNEEEWIEISRQSIEISYAFIEPQNEGIYDSKYTSSETNNSGNRHNSTKQNDTAGEGKKGMNGEDFKGVEDLSLINEDLSSGQVLIGLGTGVLNVDQLILILNSLPVDVTYVDENDKVKYYSNPADRIFPRSPAIIGRSVQNCHPPESVHIVEEILKAFKEGEKDKASFWIKMRGKYILIQYFALRDNNGNYQGTLEVGQDISDIKKIEGEKRLLDWKA